MSIENLEHEHELKRLKKLERTRAHREAFAAKNTRRKEAKRQWMGANKGELKLAREIRRGFSGKFGREKKELTERAIPGTFKK